MTKLIASALVAMLVCGCGLAATPTGANPAHGAFAAKTAQSGVATGRAVARPKDAASVGTPAEGDYRGLTLPAGWDQFAAEADVTNHITVLAAAGLTKPGSPDETTWSTFKSLYAPGTAVWQTKIGAPASTSQGAPKQGAYHGLTLPFGWDAQMGSEKDVTTRITEIADAAAAAPTGPSALSWLRFKVFFASTVVVWRHKTSRKD
jgi:hypothetical protein